MDFTKKLSVADKLICLYDSERDLKRKVITHELVAYPESHNTRNSHFQRLFPTRDQRKEGKL